MRLLSHLLLFGLTVMLTCGCSYRGNTRVSDVTLASRGNAGLKSKWQVKRDYMSQVKLARQQAGECTCFACLEKIVLENHPELAENRSFVKLPPKSESSEAPSSFALREVVDYSDTQPKTNGQNLSHVQLSAQASSRKRESTNEHVEVPQTVMAQPSENYLGINELGATAVKKHGAQNVPRTAQLMSTGQERSLADHWRSDSQRSLTGRRANSVLISEDPNRTVEFDEIGGQDAESRVAKTDVQPELDVPLPFRLAAEASIANKRPDDQQPNSRSAAATQSKEPGVAGAPRANMQQVAATPSKHPSSQTTSKEVANNAVKNSEVTNSELPEMKSAISEVRSAISEVKSELSEVRSALKGIPQQTPASNTGVMIVATESPQPARYPAQNVASQDSDPSESPIENPSAESNARSNERLNSPESRQLTSKSSSGHRPIVLKARADRRRTRETISAANQLENPSPSPITPYHATRDLEIKNVNFRPLPKMKSVNYEQHLQPKCACKSAHQTDGVERDSRCQEKSPETIGLKTNSPTSDPASAASESGLSDNVQETINSEVVVDSSDQTAPKDRVRSCDPSLVAGNDCQDITIRAIATKNSVHSQNNADFDTPSTDQNPQTLPVISGPQELSAASTSPQLIQAKTPISAPHVQTRPDAIKQMPQVSASIATPIFGDRPAIPRLHVVTGQNHIQQLPPIVTINAPGYVKKQHQEITTQSVNRTSPEQPRLRWEFPGKFDPIQLPEIENAPLIDVPGVSDSVRHLTARPGESVVPNANRATIER